MENNEKKIEELKTDIVRLDNKISEIYSNFISSFIILIFFIIIKEENISFFSLTQDQSIILMVIGVTLLFIKHHIKYSKYIIRKFLVGGKK